MKTIFKKRVSYSAGDDTRLMRKDEEWFNEHPLERAFVRPFTAPDTSLMKRTPDSQDGIAVWRIAPGIRTRTPIRCLEPLLRFKVVLVQSPFTKEWLHLTVVQHDSVPSLPTT